MKRAAVEKARTVRTWRRYAAVLRLSGWRCQLQTGRFRKGRRVGGCGTPRCYLCHGDKLANVSTVQQRGASARYREGLNELADDARTGSGP